MKLGFIGTGKITSAVITGICSSSISYNKIIISERNKSTSSILKKKFKKITVSKDNQEIINSCDWIFLSVTPTVGEKIIKNLKFRSNQTVISFISTITLAQLKKAIKVKAKIIRAIPLPPISLKKGPVPICPPNKKVKDFFNKIGTTVEIKNEKSSINFWSTSGMMAPFYELLRVMTDWLVKRGVKRNNAQKYITSLFLAKMPAAFQEKGFDAIQSGTYTLWIGTFICLTAAILVATMLKPGSRQSKPSRSSLKNLFRDGLFAAKSDSRRRLAFVASAAARGDIFVVGIFTFLWMSNFALDNGLSINQGYARGAFVIPIIAGTVLITAPIFGFIMDRIDRIYGVMIAFSLSTIGYTMMGLVDNPMSNAIIPVAIILGAGEGACIIASTTLIGKTAPIAIRGTVFGAFIVGNTICCELCFRN